MGPKLGTGLTGEDNKGKKRRKAGKQTLGKKEEKKELTAF